VVHRCGSPKLRKWVAWVVLGERGRRQKPLPPKPLRKSDFRPSLSALPNGVLPGLNKISETSQFSAAISRRRQERSEAWKKGRWRGRHG
jgi:hypothetical protein